MKALFLPADAAVPAKTLCVDGLIPGTAATYSHWLGADSPAALQHDLSTGIVLRAAAEAPRYLSGFDYVANNHVDVDGLLSMAVALDPRLIQHTDILLAAAAYGDFNYFISVAGARLALYLHQQIVVLQAQSGGQWQELACEQLTRDLPQMISRSQEPDVQRDAQIEQIQRQVQAIETGSIRLRGDTNLQIVQTPFIHGHHANSMHSVFVVDDLSLWAINTAVPASAYLLLCTSDGAGNYLQLNAPTHSWAQTHDLPSVQWPDLQELALALQVLEDAARFAVHGEAASERASKMPAQWQTLPQARRADFTCILAFLDTTGQPQPSLLAIETVENKLRPYVN